MPCPSHRPWLDHSNYTRRRVQDTNISNSAWSVLVLGNINTATMLPFNTAFCKYVKTNLYRMKRAPQSAPSGGTEQSALTPNTDSICETNKWTLAMQSETGIWVEPLSSCTKSAITSHCIYDVTVHAKFLSERCEECVVSPWHRQTILRRPLLSVRLFAHNTA
jgi:hypothetical protein